MKPHLLLLLLLILVILSSGCSSQPTPVYNGSENISENKTENQTVSSEENNSEKFLSGVASVNDVQVLFLESFPLQVNVGVTGYLPDGCTKIGNVTTQRDGTNFYVKISTLRPKDAICTQALVPFREAVSLDVYGLKKGVYTVDVNGKIVSFELPADNFLQ